MIKSKLPRPCKRDDVLKGSGSKLLYDVDRWRILPSYADSAPWGRDEIAELSTAVVYVLRDCSIPLPDNWISGFESRLEAQNVDLAAIAEMPPLSDVNPLFSYGANELADRLPEIKGELQHMQMIGLLLLQTGRTSTFFSDLLFSVHKFCYTAIMHAKHHFNRVRPYQLYPQLAYVARDALDRKFPLHSSYPSGHSTIAHLQALVLAEIYGSQFEVPLESKAHRIAENRQIAGLHYPSDSFAGRVLAKYLFDFLMSHQCFRDALHEPQQEFFFKISEHNR